MGCLLETQGSVAMQKRRQADSKSRVDRGHQPWNDVNMNSENNCGSMHRHCTVQARRGISISSHSYITKKLSPIDMACEGKISFSATVSMGMLKALKGRPLSADDDQHKMNIVIFWRHVVLSLHAFFVL